MTFQRLVALVFLSLIQTDPFALGYSTCGTTGNYTSDTAYRANINATLSSLYTNIDINGFYNASAGQGPDRVNGLALCRADVQLDTCRHCVQRGRAELGDECPVQKEAIFRDEFCTLRYSNETIYGTRVTYPGYYYSNQPNATSPEVFNKVLRAFLDDLRIRAAAGSSTRKVAGGNVTGPDFQMIFGLVQCFPDLSSEECNICLIRAIFDIPQCCSEKIGGRVFLPSCNLLFEIYQFYNETRMKELEFVPLSPHSSPTGKKNGSMTQTIVIIVVVTVVLLIVVVSAIIFLKKREKHKPMQIAQYVDDISTAECLQYPFSTIKDATNDFSNHNKLGQGGFGSVYKGKLPNGQEIAVKRLSRNSRQGNMEFKNEVLLLAKLQHKNLVRLLGFSLEGMEKLLIYEFVQNASLDNFIFDPVWHSYMDWDRRNKIIGGIARGILYLHEDSRHKIIHRDLKASNILLDSEMSPKIADFGMARLFRQDETHGNTSKVVGTYGYMPPEYLIHGQFSIKSDVYSFGVLVLEIITGRRNNGFRSEGDNVGDLMSFAWKSWQEGRVEKVVDPILRGSGSGLTNEMLRCIHIGLLCVQENAADRPTMASVVLMLSSFSMTLNIPSAPAFYSTALIPP
ncbi:cysteine-rich receptor-like protein kinase 44 [Salvia hispanica]|uniref:cysteine-rich receptor-like protein kinase 44 n=1 Tax=Salvia hispanica TaxID=49212 RepID=UPI002008F32A|nr:cysteine-rich receptor-like protein kinase 44 [Salvia hispanica]